MLKLWDGIKSFEPSEFASPDEPDSGLKMNIELIKMLDQLREKCGFPLNVTSGYRSQAHNEKVGGKPESAHTKGMAVDIYCATSHERYKIVKAAFDLGFKRIGLYKTKDCVHLDISYDLPQEVMWFT